MLAGLSNFIKKNHILFLILFLCLIKLSLITKGFSSIPDESRYYYSIFAVESLTKNDIKSFWEHIFATLGRPGDALINLIPAAIQIYLQNNFQIPYESQFSFMAVRGTFNVLVSLFIVYVFYLISQKLFRNKDVVFIATLVYALLVNSNIYLRHLLPYDISLLIYLLSLYIVIKKSNPAAYLLAGLMSGIAYTVYPGYFWFGIILFLIIITIPAKITGNVFRSFLFGIGNILPVAILEILSQNNSKPYFQEMMTLSKTVIQGAFEETVYYGPLYLLKVENITGVIVLALFCGYSINFTRDLFKKNPFNNPVHRIVISGLVVYLFYTFLGYGLHMFVLYGRLFHGFIPFAIWGALYLIDRVNQKPVRKITIYTIFVCSLISFGLFYRQFTQINYPLDVLTEFQIDTKLIPSENIYYEGKPFWYIASPPKPDFYPKPLIKSGSNLILVNVCYFYPVDDLYNPFHPNETDILLHDVPHFQNFVGYHFEGFKPEERDLLTTRNYRIKILSRK